MMREIVLKLLRLVMLGAILIPAFSFICLAAINVSELYCAIEGVPVDCEIAESDAIGTKIRESEWDSNHRHGDDFTKLTLLVVISFGTFTFFIALNIITSEHVLKEAKRELSKLKSDHDNLNAERVLIIENLRKEGKEILTKQVATFRIQLAIAEITVLLAKVHPNKRTIYAKMTDIIEDIDMDTIHIVNKCIEKFPNDEDFSRLATTVLSIIDGKRAPSP